VQELNGIEITIGHAPMGQLNMVVDRSIMFVQAIMRINHEILVFYNKIYKFDFLNKISMIFFDKFYYYIL